MSLLQKSSSYFVQSVKVIKSIIYTDSCSNQGEIANFTKRLNCNKTHTHTHTAGWSNLKKKFVVLSHIKSFSVHFVLRITQTLVKYLFTSKLNMVNLNLVYLWTLSLILNVHPKVSLEYIFTWKWCYKIAFKLIHRSLSQWTLRTILRYGKCSRIKQWQ